MDDLCSFCSTLTNKFNCYVVTTEFITPSVPMHNFPAYVCGSVLFIVRLALEAKRLLP